MESRGRRTNKKVGYCKSGQIRRLRLRSRSNDGNSQYISPTANQSNPMRAGRAGLEDNALAHGLLDPPIALCPICSKLFVIRLRNNDPLQQHRVMLGAVADSAFGEHRICVCNFFFSFRRGRCTGNEKCYRNASATDGNFRPWESLGGIPESAA